MSRNGNGFYADIMSVSSEVTGSGIYVTIRFQDGSFKHFLVDFGLFQEKDYIELNSELLFNIENIDFVLVTHNHIDHTGRLPLLVKKGYHKPIYTSHDTKSLMPLALKDTANIFKRNSKRTGISPIYDDGDVDDTAKLVIGCEYSDQVLVDEGIKVTFFKNAHLIGAALVLVQISCYGKEDINILFSGDYNNKNAFFVAPTLPKWVLDLPLTVVSESTYGNMNSSEIVPCFKENVLNFFSNKNNKTLICPVFSLGRSQEVLKFLFEMQKKGELSLDIPIYLDGKLTFGYTALFLNGILSSIDEDKDEFIPDNLTYVSNLSRPTIIGSKDTRKIILSSSGMGSYGPAESYIINYLQDPNSLIHFTGYCAEGTMSRELMDSKDSDTVKWGGVILKKVAKVACTAEFSAHAKADELICFLNTFNNLRFVIVTHGEIDSKEIFSKRVLDEVSCNNVAILSRENFFRINNWGFQKAIPSKFKLL